MYANRKLLLFWLEQITSFEARADGLSHLQKCLGGMGELGAFAINDPQLTFQLQLLYRNGNQFAAKQFRLDSQPGDERNPIAGCDKALDGLDGWHLYADVQRRLVPLECLQDFQAIG